MMLKKSGNILLGVASDEFESKFQSTSSAMKKAEMNSQMQQMIEPEANKFQDVIKETEENETRQNTFKRGFTLRPEQRISTLYDEVKSRN